MKLDNPKSKVAIFLVLTLLLSPIGWVLIIRAGSFANAGALLALMWSPGIAAILTRLITQRNLRGQGWVPRTPRLLGLAYVLPPLYALPVYLLAWGSGIGGFDPSKWMTTPLGGNSPAAALLLLASVGVLGSVLFAAGEEIGWRGLLVPELAKLTSFRNTVLISAGVWAAWHMPVIIGANYHGEGTPIAFSIACFSAMVLAISVIAAWITLKSGSLWPAALMHASHNLFVQNVFDASTVNRGSAGWLTGEFGIGLVVAISIVAWLVYQRSSLIRYASGGLEHTGQ